jgi:sensor c-di-GMP phosphodiesterase-like protein
VAEGVEDLEVWNMLRSLGCDDAQGYFMSRPLEPRALSSWIRKNTSSGLTPTFNAAEAAASMKMGRTPQ